MNLVFYCSKCGCGRPLSRHFTHVTSPSPTGALPGDKWNTIHHTEASPTDAFGTIEFQGGSHPTKAQVGDLVLSCDILLMASLILALNSYGNA